MLRTPLLMLLLSLPLASQAQVKLLSKKLFDTAAMLENNHPADFYNSAASFYSKDAKYDAAFLFYLGQLRYRYYLGTHPDLPPDGDAAIFASLNSTIGFEINFFLGSHVNDYVTELDSVLAWDKRHDYRFYSKTKDPDKQKQILEGLIKLRKYITENKKLITEENKKVRKKMKENESKDNH